MEQKISFEEEDRRWEQYDLRQYPITVNGNPTGEKAILRGARWIATVGKGYRLLPNEEALKLANAAAKMAGLESFTEFRVFGMHKTENTFFNKDQTRMHAWYLPKGTFKGGEGHEIVESKGDRLNIGVEIKNSIDGSSSFSAGLFSYRAICSNGVVWGKKTLESVYRMHTKGLEVAAKVLKTSFVALMEQAKIAAENYQALATEQVTKDLIKQIQESRLPKSILPEYLIPPEKVKEGEVQVQLIEPLQLTQWNLYNDLTEKIWHNENSDLRTKEHQFDLLHAVIPIAARRA